MVDMIFALFSVLRLSFQMSHFYWHVAFLLNKHNFFSIPVFGKSCWKYCVAQWVQVLGVTWCLGGEASENKYFSLICDQVRIMSSCKLPILFDSKIPLFNRTQIGFFCRSIETSDAGSDSSLRRMKTRSLKTEIKCYHIQIIKGDWTFYYEGWHRPFIFASSCLWSETPV